MLCTNCHSAQAAYHLKTISGGTLYEQHLCPSCAGQLSHESIGDMISGIFGDAARQERKVCPVCGISDSEVSRTAQVGCAQCYETFLELLDPYIKRIHGSGEHRGRVPAGASAEAKQRQEMRRLAEELKESVAAENFEKAAEIRDRLKILTGGEAND